MHPLTELTLKILNTIVSAHSSNPDIKILPLTHVLSKDAVKNQNERLVIYKILGTYEINTSAKEQESTSVLGFFYNLSTIKNTTPKYFFESVMQTMNL